MGVDKKVEDVWQFREKTDTTGRASIKDERGSIIVDYDQEAGTAGITVQVKWQESSISQQIDFRNGKEEGRSYKNVTKQFPVAEWYVRDNIGPMVGSFIEELRLLELEGIVDYESIEKL
jgi:hypothetical protein